MGRRRLPRLILLLVVTLALAACSDRRPAERSAPAMGTAAPVAVAPSGAATPEPTPRAVVAVPRFEPTSCPFTPARGHEEGRTLVCGFVTVPEVHADPGGRTIRLAVAVFKAHRGEGVPPLFWLDGGPGGYSLDGIAAQLTPALAAALAGDRDLVVFDQRGVGYSQPSLTCTELLDLKYATLNRRLSRAEDAERGRQAVQACHDRLVAAGVNLAAYTSAESAADVDDLRRALGYGEINLYGVSYGTRLALTVMRDFPHILRAVVLDSPVPLQANLYVDVYGSAQRAFDLLFQRCAADAGCNAAYPNLEDEFYALVRRLNAAPVPVPFIHPRTRAMYTYLLTGDRLVSALFQMLYYGSIIPDLPRTIIALRDGDPAPFVRHYRDLLFYDQLSQGMYLSVQCGEEARFTSTAEVQQAARRVRPEIGAQQGEGFGDDWFFRACGLWGARPAAPIENEPVTSEVPTLVLAGEFDPITPPAYAEEAARTLRNAYLFVFPGLGHGPGQSHPCPLLLLRAFLQDPGRRPEHACLGALRGPTWVLRSR